MAIPQNLNSDRAEIAQRILNFEWKEKKKGNVRPKSDTNH